MSINITTKWKYYLKFGNGNFWKISSIANDILGTDFRSEAVDGCPIGSSYWSSSGSTCGASSGSSSGSSSGLSSESSSLVLHFGPLVSPQWVLQFGPLVDPQWVLQWIPSGSSSGYSRTRITCWSLYSVADSELRPPERAPTSNRLII